MEKLITTSLLIFAASLSFGQHQSVWVEGEAANQKSVSPHGWYESVKKDELSGGDWIANWGKTPGTASYKIQIPKAGGYTLWLRANPVQSSLKFRFDEGEWVQVDFKANKHETINIASDNKPDLRITSWVSAGIHEFAAGEHQIGVRFDSANNNHGSLDCFCLTTDKDWRPRRFLKPRQAAPAWSAPELTDDNLEKWLTFLQPSDDELGWRKMRWHHSLSEAAAEAKLLGRPVLLWAMNGHPCGET